MSNLSGLNLQAIVLAQITIIEGPIYIAWAFKIMKLMGIKANEVEDSCKFISCENDDRKKELEKTKTELKSLKSNCKTLEDKISKFENKVVDLEACL